MATAVLFRYYGWNFNDMKVITPYLANLYLEQVGNVSRLESGKSLKGMPDTELAFEVYRKQANREDKDGI